VKGEKRKQGCRRRKGGRKVREKKEQVLAESRFQMVAPK
jgi:hypothetical protein